MPNPFVIFSLPRSRSAWLAHYLAYEGRKIGHDITIECKSIRDFFACFDRAMIGTIETGEAIIGADVLHRVIPEAKIVVIRRNLGEVRRSLGQFGIVADEELEIRSAMLDKLSQMNWVETLEYSDLCLPSCCAWLFEHLLGIPFDPDWHYSLAGINIQVDMQARLAQLQSNASALAILRNEMQILSKVESQQCQQLN